jgi:hypothetical protein
MHRTVVVTPLFEDGHSLSLSLACLFPLRN